MERMRPKGGGALPRGRASTTGGSIGHSWQCSPTPHDPKWPVCSPNGRSVWIFDISGGGDGKDFGMDEWANEIRAPLAERRPREQKKSIFISI